MLPEICLPEKCFNSILVRLGEHPSRLAYSLISGFNSILVRLGGLLAEIKVQNLACFNSILVRLGDASPVTTMHYIGRFNSILVRLGAKVLQDGSLEVKLFQFHSGAIRCP